jgi:hypothetical protein
MHYNSGEHDLLTYMRNPEVFSVREGMVALLEGAGLGIEVDEARIRDEDRQFREGTVKAWRNPVCTFISYSSVIYSSLYSFCDIFVGRGPDGAIREW